MKVSEAVEQMSKLYLHRVIESFTRDFPRLDEERARETIVKNADELTDPARIERRLEYKDVAYAERILATGVLEILLNAPGSAATEREIVEIGTAAQEKVIAESGSDDGLQYEDPRSLDILRTVLEVAVEDERISEEEISLIRRLREKLGVTRKSQHLLLAQLEHYPRTGNRVHTPSDFREALSDLQRRGVVFYCNRLPEPQFVVPDEMVRGVKAAIGLELSDDSYRLLLDALTVHQLAEISKEAGLPTYGRKDERIDRIVDAGIRPSEALDSLTNKELYEILGGLAGANVSGSKQERTNRIIDYFANLVIKPVPSEADPGERYYGYFVELAHRDRENLLANKVIKKDRNMDAAFEEGARYLFANRLGLESLPTPGSDHADGVLELSSGDLFMWDTKSKESVYAFPASHVTQFKRYIRDADRRVSCFLVIVPEIDERAEHNAARLKFESREDTDVALIAAEDLKWVAEDWVARGEEHPFNLEVFNITGVLNRDILRRRMEMFL